MINKIKYFFEIKFEQTINVLNNIKIYPKFPYPKYDVLKSALEDKISEKTIKSSVFYLIF